MSIGIVLDEAWTLFTRFFLCFFGIALVVFATIDLLYALVVSAIAIAIAYFRLRDAQAVAAEPVET